MKASEVGIVWVGVCCRVPRGREILLYRGKGVGNGHWLPAALIGGIHGDYGVGPVGASGEVWLESCHRSGVTLVPGESVSGLVPGRVGDLCCA